MDLSDIWNQALSVLRDNAFQGIGTIFAFLVVVIPWFSRKFGSRSLGGNFQSIFWWSSIPLLSVLTILSAMWQKMELAIVFSVALVILYVLRQREVIKEFSELDRRSARLEEYARKDASERKASPYDAIKREKR